MRQGHEDRVLIEQRVRGHEARAVGAEARDRAARCAQLVVDRGEALGLAVLLEHLRQDEAGPEAPEVAVRAHDGLGALRVRAPGHDQVDRPRGTARLRRGQPLRIEPRHEPHVERRRPPLGRPLPTLGPAPVEQPRSGVPVLGVRGGGSEPLPHAHHVRPEQPHAGRLLGALRHEVPLGPVRGQVQGRGSAPCPGEVHGHQGGERQECRHQQARAGHPLLADEVAQAARPQDGHEAHEREQEALEGEAVDEDHRPIGKSEGQQHGEVRRSALTSRRGLVAPSAAPGRGEADQAGDQQARVPGPQGPGQALEPEAGELVQEQPVPALDQRRAVDARPRGRALRRAE